MEWNYQKESDHSGMGMVRCSTKGQMKGASPEAQEREIRKYAEENNIDLRYVVHISESAWNSEDRTAYKKEIGKCLRSKIKHVLFYMSDREARNCTDIENNTKLIKAGRMVVHHVQEHKVYWKRSSRSDFFMRSINGVVHSDTSETISIKVLSGLKAKAEMGLYPGGNVPLGYVCRREIVDGREKAEGLAKVYPDTEHPEKMRIVLREFELKASGLSVERIRRQILEEGLVSPHEPYSKFGISKRLHSKIYYGYFDYDGIEYRGNHDLFIPAKTRERVQHLLNQERGFSTAPINRDSLFGGFIKCAMPECGGVIIFDPKRRENERTGKTTVYKYYHCANGRRLHTTLKGHIITEEAIMQSFGPLFRKLTISPEFAGLVAEEINTDSERGKKTLKDEESKLRRQKEELLRDEDEAWKYLKNGTLDKDAYQRQIKKIRTDRDRIELRLQEAQDASKGIKKINPVEVLELCIEAESLWNEAEDEERVDFVKKVCSDIYLEGVTIRYNLKKPFQMLTEMANSDLWWG